MNPERPTALIATDPALLEGYQHTLNRAVARLDELAGENARLHRERERARLLSIEQACAFMGGCTPENLLYHRKHGLDYIKKGQTVLYVQGDLEDWIDSGRVRNPNLIYKSQNK